jgi:phosphoribosylaminoimidazole-succinocarboxamide synthase
MATSPANRPLLPGLPHVASGKVRDIYAVGEDALLLVTSDTVSAYDWILRTPIPDKGRILTALSLWWFERLADVVPNHLLASDVADFPASLRPYADALRGRSMLVRRLEMIPVECVARGYLAGSGLAEYRASGAICGVPLPAGLVEASRLPEPIFTPTTKAELGAFDESIDYPRVVATVGTARAAELRKLTLAIYQRAHAIAAERGLILADTKFEFGVPPGAADLGQITLADEVLTSDSSRYWLAEQWRPGTPQEPLDKQLIRNWLVSPESGWQRASGEPPPELPEAVVAQTRQRYVDAYERLTGQRFS